LLGAELDFYYGEEFKTLMMNNEFAQQVRMVIYTDINVSKLLDQKIDAFIADQKVAEYYISKLGLNKQIVALPIIINETDVRIMVSKSTASEQFVKQLNDEINKLVKSEKYSLLESKYLKQ
jgi:ABC-type amino acid transport substrate-binding protein